MYKIIFATVLGNIFEYYDFLLFGFALDFMGRAFLPPALPGQSLWLLLIFAIGFLARPIGACVLGRVGDLYGRRISILLSISLLATATALIGCLPGYSTIGLCAPILLIGLRLMQSFAVSVEQIGSSIFLIESFKFNWNYFSSALIFGTVYLGAALALLIWIVLSALLSHEDIINFGWRIPFLLAMPLGIIVAVMRYKLHESKEYILHRKECQHQRVKYADIARSAALFISLAISSYMSVIYMPTLSTAGEGQDSFRWIFHFIGYIITFAGALCCGYLVDFKHINGKKILNFALSCNIILAPLIYGLAQSQSLGLIFMANCIAAVLLAMQAATILAATLHMYNFATRYSALSIGFTLSQTTFGGFAPFIAEYLHQNVHVLAPALYVMFGSVITLLSLNLYDHKVGVSYASAKSA